MRVILINSETREVKEMEIDDADARQYRTYVTGLVSLVPNRDVLFIDRLSVHEDAQHYFIFLDRILPGNGVLFGEDPGDGEAAPARSTVEEIVAMVGSASRADLLDAKQKSETKERDPIV